MITLRKMSQNQTICKLGKKTFKNTNFSQKIDRVDNFPS